MCTCDKWKQRPDQDINVQHSGNFNREMGLCNFKSLSTQKPFENSMDPGLIFGTQEGNDLVKSSMGSMYLDVFWFLYFTVD